MSKSITAKGRASRQTMFHGPKSPCQTTSPSNERVVVEAQQPEDGRELLVRGRDADRVADVRMHLAALGARLAVNPAEDVSTLLVDAEPARRGAEADPLEVRVADANDIVDR